MGNSRLTMDPEKCNTLKIHIPIKGKCNFVHGVKNGSVTVNVTRILHFIREPRQYPDGRYGVNTVTLLPRNFFQKKVP